MTFLLEEQLDVDACIDFLIGTENVFKAETPTPLQLWRSQIRALSKAITFLESDPLLSEVLLGHESLMHIKHASKAQIIGVTGLPGAGKSSLTNLLVKKFREENKKVAVLCVDPSSQISGGAILGDRVRMQDHFKDDFVFIRSMGSRGALGGLAQATRGALGLIKLLNFDVIIIESVGVGQSESDIVHLADTTMLVLMPNSGDEIQLMKAGLLQLAQIFVINKCDLSDPSRMLQELEENFGTHDENDWSPPVIQSSCHNLTGIDSIIESIAAHLQFISTHGQQEILKLNKIKQEVSVDLSLIMKPHFTNWINELDKDTLELLKSGSTTSMYVAQKLLSSKLNLKPIKKTL